MRATLAQLARRNWTAIVVVVSACVSVGAIAIGDGPLWWREWVGIVAIVIVFSSGVFVGRRETYAEIERSLQGQPRNVHIIETEDGRKMAIVEKVGGEVVSLDVPDEIESDDPQQIAWWVVQELQLDDDD